MFHAGTSQENERRRAQYMLDLKMRADLDDRVLQAVKLNKRTGQSTIPLTDMRTLDEKMQDLERLKSTVRLDLLTITDAANTTEILGGLNTHDLQFVAQQFPLLSAEIKPKYKMGITATQFFIFLREYEMADAVHPVAGRPVGINDMADIPVRAQVEAVADLAEAAGLPAENIAALRRLAQAAPIAPLRAGDVGGLAGVPNRAEMDNLQFGLEAGDARALEAVGEIPVEAADWLIQSTKKKRAPRTPVGPEGLSKAQIKLLEADVRSEALARRIPIRRGGNKYIPLDELQASIKADKVMKGEPVKGPAEVGGFGVRMKGHGIASVEDKLTLGRYNINTRKLADNIVQIRSAKGGAVHRFPTTSVSDSVKSALHKIISGGDLSFDDISGLSESERRYLHDVSTQCGIKTSIPQPKDAVAAQADRYEILRGQLLAGQDNQEMIREFKTLILKMSASGQLPKGQVREILLDLVALGK